MSNIFSLSFFSSLRLSLSLWQWLYIYATGSAHRVIIFSDRKLRVVCARARTSRLPVFLWVIEEHRREKCVRERDATERKREKKTPYPRLGFFCPDAIYKKKRRRKRRRTRREKELWTIEWKKHPTVDRCNRKRTCSRHHFRSRYSILFSLSLSFV